MEMRHGLEDRRSTSKGTDASYLPQNDDFFEETFMLLDAEPDEIYTGFVESIKEVVIQTFLFSCIIVGCLF